jgi:hypothetical protein
VLEIAAAAEDTAFDAVVGAESPLVSLSVVVFAAAAAAASQVS